METKTDKWPGIPGGVPALLWWGLASLLLIVAALGSVRDATVDAWPWTRWFAVVLAATALAVAPLAALAFRYLPRQAPLLVAWAALIPLVFAASGGAKTLVRGLGPDREHVMVLRVESVVKRRGRGQEYLTLKVGHDVAPWGFRVPVSNLQSGDCIAVPVRRDLFGARWTWSVHSRVAPNFRIVPCSSYSAPV